jgi:hypothetical protein
VAEVIVAQLIVLFFAASLTDGGSICGMYARMLAGYWLAVGVARLFRLVYGRSFRRLLIATAWMPVATCLVWATAT